METTSGNPYFAFRIQSVKFKVVLQHGKLVESLRLFGTPGAGSTVLQEIEVLNGKDQAFTCNISDPTRFVLTAPSLIFSDTLFISRHWSNKGIDLEVDGAGNVVYFSIESPNE